MMSGIYTELLNWVNRFVVAMVIVLELTVVDRQFDVSFQDMY
jgi:hypothetical protein